MKAAARRPTLSDQRFWRKRRTHYLAVFERALMLLREHDSLPDQEPELNRELRFAVVTARRELDRHGLFGRPIFEAQNPPDPDAENVQSHEYKRPDIQWIHDDPAAVDDRHCEKCFAVECKRLGLPPSPRWKLNEQYVVSGIARFRSPTYQYGMHLGEGAMIAYVQNMDISAAHAEVCGHAAAANMPALLLTAEGWRPGGVTYLAHGFDRAFPVSPFHLTHLWLDIHDVPVRARATPPKKVGKKTRAKGAKKPQS